MKTPLIVIKVMEKIILSRLGRNYQLPPPILFMF